MNLGRTCASAGPGPRGVRHAVIAESLIDSLAKRSRCLQRPTIGIERPTEYTFGANPDTTRTHRKKPAQHGLPRIVGTAQADAYLRLPSDVLTSSLPSTPISGATIAHLVKTHDLPQGRRNLPGSDTG